jgi:hypothetical protein
MTKAKDKGRLPPFVPLLKDTMKTPAWRALSHGARSLYISLKLRYSSNFKNNGKVYLSQRDAKEEIGSGFEEITNWFHELEHYGFIVKTKHGHLNFEGTGLATHWRLTEVGFMKDPPTRDFMKWDGTKFKRHRRTSRDQGKTESRTGKAVHPAPERRSIQLHRKGGAVPPQPAPERRSIREGSTAPERRSVTSLTTTNTSLRLISNTPLPAEPLPPTMVAMSEVVEPVVAAGDGRGAPVAPAEGAQPPAYAESE